MSPLEQKVADLEKRVTDIENVTNPAFLRELERRLASGSLTIETGASLTGTTVSVRNVTDDGSELVADDYVGAINIFNNGVLIGKIGYYS